MNNWILLHRKLKNWEWYHNSHMVHLFIDLLLSANHKDGNWQGIEIKRGQLITGRQKLSENTGISQQILRTCLTKLKSTSEITIKSTNKYSIITIVKYEDYQLQPKKITSKSTNKLTNNQPTTNQQLTTNNKDKNVNNEKETLPIGNAESVSFGNSDINTCLAYFENQLNSSLDGSQKENRNYCYLLIGKFKKDYPDKNSTDLIKKLIDLGLTDDFHAKNTTSFKYLYYNAVKIIQSAKQKFNSPKIVKI